MATKPAKLLRVTLNDLQPSSPLPSDDGTNDPWLANACLWNAKISVTPQPHSSHVYGSHYYYTGVDVAAGDWIVTSGSGAALRIKEITTATETSIECVLEDVNRANAFQNADQSGQGEIPMGEGLLFEVKNGIPILYPLPDALPGTIPLTFGVQLISRAFKDLTLGNGGGASTLTDLTDAPNSYAGQAGKAVVVKTTEDGVTFANINKLENPADGIINDGAIKTWQVGNTTYSTAIDDLNKILGMLIPSPPPALSTKTIGVGVNSRAGINIMLANNVTSNSDVTGKPLAGQQVYISNTGITISNTVSGFGSGNSGQLQAFVNGSENGHINLTSATNLTTDGALQILRDSDYPAEKPGFWQELDARISTTVPEGLNSFRMNHTETGSTNEAFFVFENSVTPIASTLAVTQNIPVVTNSSGVPHYATGASLSSAFSVSGVGTNVYLASSLAQVDSSPTVGTTIDVNPGTNGFTSILDKNLPPKNINVDFMIGGNTHTTSKIRVRARNAHTDGAWVNDVNNILVMSGNIANTTVSGPVVEMSVPVVNLGTLPSGTSVNAFRIVMSNGDKPSDDKSSLTASDWNSGNPLAAYDASVVGGVLQHDTNNYATGYLPVGPNYSIGRSGPQYITFAFRRSAVSNFKIEVAGSYGGMWVKLPGLTFPTATSNWLDMFKIAGSSGVPGRAPNDDGCAFGTAATGSSGTFTCTFGTESSTNSTNNLILVRFKLSAGHRITGLVFKG